jgi:hypothetical protein
MSHLRLIKRLAFVFPLVLIQGCDSKALETVKLCGYALPACVWQAIKPKPTPDPQCKKEPSLILPQSVQTKSIAVHNWRALSWLEPIRTNYPSLSGGVPLSFEYLAPILAKSRFEAIELKEPVLTERNFLGVTGFYELVGNVSNVGWVRLSLQSKGHPACKAFEIALEKNKRWLPDSLLKSGITEGQCIAVEVISSPRSSFGLDVVTHPESSPEDFRESWLVRDLRSNTTYAELVRHIAPSRDCPLQSMRQEFAKIVKPDG